MTLLLLSLLSLLCCGAWLQRETPTPTPQPPQSPLSQSPLLLLLYSKCAFGTLSGLGLPPLRHLLGWLELPVAIAIALRLGDVSAAMLALCTPAHGAPHAHAHGAPHGGGGAGHGGSGGSGSGGGGGSGSGSGMHASAPPQQQQSAAAAAAAEAAADAGAAAPAATAPQTSLA